MQITEPTIVLEGNHQDLGITARLNNNGFVAVDIGMGCDPEVFTDELVASEKAGMPGWRFRKEYLREWAAQAGQPVFEPEWLDVQKARLCDPLVCMDLSKDGKTLIEKNGGRVKIWVKPDPVKMENDPLIVSKTPAFGAGSDVGEGVGQSDSTIEVFSANGREQAAEFASNTITPSDLGKMAAAMCRYYNNALICPVRPMHGITLIRALRSDCGYGYIWRDRSKYRMTDVRSENLGWAKGEASSPDLFGGFVNDVQYDFCSIHSLALFQQMQQYIYDEFGHITQSALAHLPLSVRQRHGDLVIGAALACRACIDLPKFLREQPKNLAPEGSAAHRHELHEKKQRQNVNDGW